MIDLCFSILASDFAHLADEVAAATRGGGSIVHVDVMDGHFVPNITFGPPMVKALRPITKLPLDCHLMIENPDAFIPAFAEAGADMISVQQEVCRHLHRTLQLIADHGALPGVVINPATPVETLIEVLPMVHYVLVMSVNPGFGGQRFLPLALEKIEHLAEIREALGLNFRIEVDGGVAHDTVTQVVQAGAEMLVAGSAVFEPGRAEENAVELLRLARAAAPSGQS
jgi:ribulose-phosphate 3-epimerase